MITYKLNRKLNNYAFFLISYIILLALALIPYYVNGCIILGGEGDYAFDFSTHLGNYNFTWTPNFGIGIPNLAPNGTGLNILLLYLIEKLTGSVAITNFILIFSIYFFPFFAMYLVCKELKATPFISFVCSLFYVINPYMLYYLICLNQWNVFSVTVMPLFLWIILKNYHNNFKLFFFSGLISVCFSFAYTNLPMLVIIHISIILSVFVVSYYRNEKLIISQIFKKYSILLISFIAFNCWWILSFFAGAMSIGKKIYSISFAESWLKTVVEGHGAIIAKMFSLTTNIGDTPYFSDFFTFIYNSISAKLITLIPIFIIVYLVLIIKDKRTSNVLNCAIFCFLLIVIFFVKGNSDPFGFIYDFMFEHLPFFNIFKTPVEKFGLLFIFIFSTLMLFVINSIKNQIIYRHILAIFIAYLVFCSLPMITGNIIPEQILSDGKCVSRKYKDKPEYKQLREEVNNDGLQYRILSMPGVGNYQVLLQNYNNKYYTGLDPVLMNTNKSIIAIYHHIDLLYENISLTNYRKLLGIYNIRKIVINEDLIPWFGVIGIGDIPELKKIFSEFLISKSWGSITLYDNQDDFLPRIYIVSTLRY